MLGKYFATEPHTQLITFFFLICGSTSTGLQTVKVLAARFDDLSIQSQDPT